MSKCDITVTMPIEEYERLKEDAVYWENKFKTLFKEINEIVDVDVKGRTQKYASDKVYEYLKTFVYEVKYDL
ncbi:MAG: hypothetical protein IJ445_06970 [Clostridia bacterium]|nr:hypothetical protein [Clostridia bacterium]